MSTKIRVTVWNEFHHERHDEAVKKLYPNGIHAVIAKGLAAADDIETQTATLEEPQHGLSEDVLANTDVVVWWSHARHADMQDEIVERVRRRVLEGMGLVVLHSALHSKVFLHLIGTTCAIRWREDGERERLWNIEPAHPITDGIGDYIELPNTEMYGERFDIPTPDKLIFISWFEGGEVFRSGCCYERGHGRIFYFRPGHETYPIYYNEEVVRVLINAARWAKPRVNIPLTSANTEPLERIEPKDTDAG